jgi:hypothetical protein
MRILALMAEIRQSKHKNDVAMLIALIELIHMRAVNGKAVDRRLVAVANRLKIIPGATPSQRTFVGVDLGRKLEAINRHNPLYVAVLQGMIEAEYEEHVPAGAQGEALSSCDRLALMFGKFAKQERNAQRGEA